MEALHAAVEAAVAEAAEDTGLSEDEIWHDIALAVLVFWDDADEAAEYAETVGITLGSAFRAGPVKSEVVLSAAAVQRVEERRAARALDHIHNGWVVR